MSAEERPVLIVPDHVNKTPRIYANYVQVNMSPIDCTLTFCDVLGPQSEEEALRMQKSGTLPAPVVTVLVLPNPVVDGLIQALQAQRDKQTGRISTSTGSAVQ